MEAGSVNVHVLDSKTAELGLVYWRKQNSGARQLGLPLLNFCRHIRHLEQECSRFLNLHRKHEASLWSMIRLPLWSLKCPCFSRSSFQFHDHTGCSIPRVLFQGSCRPDCTLSYHSEVHDNRTLGYRSRFPRVQVPAYRTFP